MLPDDPRHGENRGYEAGCREMCCRRAHMRYSKKRRMTGPLLVDITGSRRRIEALQTLGWSMNELSQMLGYEKTYLRTMLNHTRAGKVQRPTAAKIADLYERLCMTPALDPAERPRGWNASRDRTKREAARRGFVPPLAWEGIDIDDPTATPHGAGYERTNYTREELAAEWDHLRSAGVSIHTAASQLGVTVGAIEKACERARKAAA